MHHLIWLFLTYISRKVNIALIGYSILNKTVSWVYFTTQNQLVVTIVIVIKQKHWLLKLSLFLPRYINTTIFRTRTSTSQTEVENCDLERSRTYILFLALPLTSHGTFRKSLPSQSVSSFACGHWFSQVFLTTDILNRGFWERKGTFQPVPPQPSRAP